MADNKTIRFLQKHVFKADNSFTANSSDNKSDLNEDVEVFRDIAYPGQWPNSFLDLYLHRKKTDKPILVFIHGGGYCWGDKAFPMEQWYKEQLVNAGFNMVSYNYALSPKYRYPVPVHQLNEALKALPELAENYGFGADQIVMAGTSAGSQLCGQLINCFTNPEYAKELGIEPAFDRNRLKGAILGSSLLDPERINKTGLFLTDWLFGKCGKSYYAVDHLKGDPNVIQSSVIRYAIEDFPPVYLTDANIGSFEDQAIEFTEKLRSLGVRVELNLYPAKEVKLAHGYENSDSKAARDNLEKTLKFLLSL